MLGLAVLLVPLSLLWAYALYDSLHGAEASDADGRSWPALLLLTGFFGGLAYLALVLVPRLQRSRGRFRLRTLGAA
jgi:hypothetical protein